MTPQFIGRGANALGGLTPDWIKSIEDAVRPGIKEAVKKPINVTVKPPVKSPSAVPTVGTAPAPVSGGFAPWEWVKANPLPAAAIGLALAFGYHVITDKR